MKSSRIEKRKCRLARKRAWEERKRQRNQYPDFVFAGKADPGFMREVENAARRFDFGELTDIQQQSFKLVRYYGIELMLMSGAAAMDSDCLRLTDPGCPLQLLASNFKLNLEDALGEAILRHIPDSQRRHYLPFNDVTVGLFGNRILWRFRAQRTVRVGHRTIYHSDARPGVELDGGNYTVAFGRHALEQVSRRLAPHWTSYEGQLRAGNHLEDGMLYEGCRLPDGQPAFTFYVYSDCRELSASCSPDEVLAMHTGGPNAGHLFW